jgi:hypothetical protein
LYLYFPNVFRIMYNNLSLTNSTLLTADVILLSTKKPVPKSWFSSHFSQKNVYSPAGSVPPPPHLTSCTPSKSNLYFETSSATVLSEPALYRLLTFDVPNLISIFFRLGRLSKESVQVRGFLWSFVTSLFLGQGVVSPMANPQAWGPPLVGCPRLLIQYIRSYPPYLEAAPSIGNLRTRHAVVTRDPPNMAVNPITNPIPLSSL